MPIVVQFNVKEADIRTNPGSYYLIPMETLSLPRRTYRYPKLPNMIYGAWVKGGRLSGVTLIEVRDKLKEKRVVVVPAEMVDSGHEYYVKELGEGLIQLIVEFNKKDIT